MTDTLNASVAVVHGQITNDGGAERVAIELARAVDAPIYSPHTDGKAKMPDDVEIRTLQNSGTLYKAFTKLPLPRSLQWLGYHINRVQSHQWFPELVQYDILIQSKPEVSWYVPPTEQTVIRYMHHLPRRHYDQFHAKCGSVKGRLFSASFRPMYRQTLDYPDLLIANSETTKRRIRRYTRVNENRVAVVHPGVNTDHISPDANATQDYFLYLGRLASNKRIPLLVEIAEQTDHTIVVAGTGDHTNVIENCSAENLNYQGYVNESTKAKLLAGAKATLFPAVEEDFGIVPIESFAAGTPVIGANEGYTRYQINDGGNGYLVKPSVDAFADAMNTIESDGVTWTPEEMRQYATQFSIDRFHTEMRKLVRETHEQTQPDTRNVPPRPQRAIANGGELNE